VLQAVDLFAGGGGATRGLRDAGFDVVAAVENDPHAAATWRLNHDGKLFEADIREVGADDIAQLVARGPDHSELDLLKSCAPCQGFSSLRGGREADPDRNDLVLDTLRFVDGLTPRAVLLENVPGLRRDARFPKLITALRARGYSVQDYVLEATALGVPQRRRRLVVLAVNGGAAPPDSVKDLVAMSGLGGAATAGEAFASLVDTLAEDDPWHRWRKSGSPAVSVGVIMPSDGRAVVGSSRRG
jgi:DNA (cytosine-5)-methyltransferase 1